MGQRLFKLAKFVHANSEMLVDRYERLCAAPSSGSFVTRKSGSSRRLPRFLQMRKNDSSWTHSYCFNKAQRIERMLTIATGICKFMPTDITNSLQINFF